MKILGVRFCRVSAEGEALAGFLEQGLGLDARRFDGAAGGFSGAVFPAGNSWVEVWQQAEGMPAGTMLQIVVDDADALARTARENGLDPKGPVDEHGERIYFLTAPDGLPVSFQSRLAGSTPED